MSMSWSRTSKSHEIPILGIHSRLIGVCSFCGAVRVNRTTCPHNSAATNPNPAAHNLSPIREGAAPPPPPPRLPARSVGGGGGGIEEEEEEENPHLRYYRQLDKGSSRTYTGFITETKRRSLIEFMNTFCEGLSLEPRLFHLSVAILDRYLNKKVDVQQFEDGTGIELRVCILAVLGLASKYEGGYSLIYPIEDILPSINKSMLNYREMEKDIVDVLEWLMPTSLAYDYMLLMNLTPEKLDAANQCLKRALGHVESLNYTKENLAKACCTPETNDECGAFITRLIGAPYRKDVPVVILGDGSYGNVVQARDEGNNNALVALKRVETQDSDGITQSALREVSIMKRLNDIGNPNIIRLIDYNWEQLVMPIFTPDLDRYLEIYVSKKKQINPVQVKHFSRQLLSAIDSCHKCGFMHRDLKPANILLTTKNKKSGLRDLKITDFGLAREFSPIPGRLYTSLVITLPWRPPELLEVDNVCIYGPEVDIWSIGVIITEMMTPTPMLWGDPHTQKLLHKKIKEDLADDQWPPLKDRTFIRKMLTYNPKERVGADKILEDDYFTAQRDKGGGGGG